MPVVQRGRAQKPHSRPQRSLKPELPPAPLIFSGTVSQTPRARLANLV